MISDQLDAYPGQERFAHAMLGLLSVCELFVAALEHERRDGALCSDGSLVDFALGVVSLRRTLHVVSTTISETEPASASQASAESIDPPEDASGWLR